MLCEMWMCVFEGTEPALLWGFNCMREGPGQPCLLHLLLPRCFSRLIIIFLKIFSTFLLVLREQVLWKLVWGAGGRLTPPTCCAPHKFSLMKYGSTLKYGLKQVKKVTTWPTWHKNVPYTPTYPSIREEVGGARSVGTGRWQRGEHLRAHHIHYIGETIFFNV